MSLERIHEPSEVVAGAGVDDVEIVGQSSGAMDPRGHPPDEDVLHALAAQGLEETPEVGHVLVVGVDGTLHPRVAVPRRSDGTR
jgi:hypothetical protein